MGKNELRKRDKWQNRSGVKAGVAEQSFHEVFQECFQGTNFSIRANPKEFDSIYVDYPLLKSVLTEIYTPSEKIKKHGITPDFAIDHAESGKTLYIEIKSQDGWVEGKKRSAGRGNAHERVCKYFTPGLKKILREKGGITEPALPFWAVFRGDITRDPCRVREITCWFGKYPEHLFFWRNSKDPNPLIDHFDSKLKSLLY